MEKKIQTRVHIIYGDHCQPPTIFYIHKNLRKVTNENKLKLMSFFNACAHFFFYI